MMLKEIDLKLTLGMAERRKTESPPNEELWGGGVSDLNLGQTRSHQVWNQTDWTPLQVALDLWVYSQDWQAPVMGHGGWWRISPGLEGGKLDPTKMELAQTPRQSLSSSFKKCKCNIPNRACWKTWH